MAAGLLLASLAGGAWAQAAPVATALGGYYAGFKAPMRIATDAGGNLYVTDPKKGEVLVRDANGRVLSRGTAVGTPMSIAVNAAGTMIYVGDGDTGSVTAFSADWTEQFKLGTGDGEFLQPNDIGIRASNGDVYVVDTGAHLVKIYNSSGVPQGSFGGLGSAGGQFNFPVALFVGASDILVVDQWNYRIQVFGLGGNFLSSFGAQGSDPGYFNKPQGVWKDAQGRVYVADGYEGWIQVLTQAGGFLAHIGDFGKGPGQLNLPMDVVMDSSNRLIVTSANNGRLELFGIDTFTDPESVVPAEVAIEPQPLDRAKPQPVVVAYVEVPGYAADEIAPGALRANGVSANASPVSAGDHDGNGVPDLRVEFAWDDLLATLPADGTGTVAMTGTVGGKQLEGALAVQVLTTVVCGPEVVCSLGGADPLCNEAVCVEPSGCTVQPKADGVVCDDGNVCTTGETCSAGICGSASPLDCDDGNACSDDACDAIGGCVHRANSGGACEDGSACTVGDVCVEGACVAGAPPACDDANLCTDDTCDPAIGCVSTANTAPCDDADACTVDDICDGGVCAGGPPRVCSDGNVCTDDWCDAALGCVFSANTASCSDGNACSVNDQCVGGVCQAGSTCAGGVRHGVSFDAARRQSVESAGPWNLTGTQLTVALWANVTALSPEQYPTLISLWDNANSANASFVLNTGANVGQARILVFTDNGQLVSCQSDNVLNLVPNEWHHVAATLDGTTLRCYVDGVQVGRTGAWPAGRTIRGSTQPVRLGARDGQKYLTGTLDDVRIYDRGLSAGEIAQLSHDCGGGCGNWPANLVAWWKLDEGSGTTAADGSGNGHAGTLVNGPVWAPAFSCCIPWPTYTPTPGAPTATPAPATATPTPTATPAQLPTCSGGQTRTGVAFTAATQSSVDGGTWNLSGNQLTVALWANVTALSPEPFPSLLSKWNNNNASNAVFVLNTGAGLGAARMLVYADDGTLVSCNTDRTVLFAANQWHHIAATLDGTTLRCYVDGVRVGTTGAWPAGRAIRQSAHHVRLGGRDDAKYLTGILDDVRIYDRGLSAEEIAAIYNGSVGSCDSGPANLMAWWQLDDGVGTSATDGSGNGRPGTLTNHATWSEGFACCP